MRSTDFVLVSSVTILAGCAGGDAERLGSTTLELTDVTLLDVGLNNTFGIVQGINESGEAVGAYGVDSTIHAMRLSGTTVSDAHAGGFVASHMYAVSATGGASGYVTNALWTSLFAAVWPAEGGGPIMIDNLGGSIMSIAYQINSSMQAGGTWVDSSSSQRAFFWSSATGMLDVGDLGGDRTFFNGMNELGQVVGSSEIAPYPAPTHAILWQDGVLTDLGTLGGNGSSASDINDNGLIVGSAQTSAGVWHACKWQDGVVTDLDPLNPEGSLAFGVNNSGHIVGMRHVAGQTHATLWRDGGAIDLGVGPGSDAFTINELDIVTGFSQPLSYVWANPADGPIDLPAPPGTTDTLVTGASADRVVGVGTPGFFGFVPYPGARAAVWHLEITPPPPNEVIDVLEEGLQDLGLEPGLTNSLDGKLEAALHQCARGNENAAKSQIEAFIHHVRALIRSNRIAAGDGQNLIALAQASLDDLSCP